MKLGLFLCWIWFAIVVEAMEEEPANCTRGPSDFRNWNTTGTGWAEKSYWFQTYMSADFKRNKASSEALYRLSSPVLCSDANTTYDLSLDYSVGWRSICYLAVYVQSEGRTRPLWRSSGSDFFRKSRTLSPPVRFRTCSSSFQLIFEARKTERGKCGWFSSWVGLANVAYTPVHRRPAQKGLCPGVDPVPDDDDLIGLSAWETIAILAALAVVIIILASLLILVAIGRRRRQSEQLVTLKSAASYETFSGSSSQRLSMADYESMDGDKLQRTQLLPSGRHDPYDRLHARKEVAPGAEGAAPAHYDHFEGDRAYSGLNEQSRVRDIQRRLFADNYNHM